jgi:hypothetical protein
MGRDGGCAVPAGVAQRDRERDLDRDRDCDRETERRRRLEPKQ